MGSIADAMTEYAQPLIDSTDGSMEQMNKALSLSQLCWNLAILPEKDRDEAIARMQSSLKLDDEDFDDFRRSVVMPMVRRHREMFPRLHRRGEEAPTQRTWSPPAPSQMPSSTKKYPGTGRNARCPCGSGQKYKRCCGR